MGAATQIRHAFRSTITSRWFAFRLACHQWPGCANDRDARNVARSPTGSMPIACSSGWPHSILTPSEPAPVCCASATPIRWSCRVGWTLDDTREPKPPLFKAPRTTTTEASTTPAAGDVRWTQPGRRCRRAPAADGAGSHGRRAERRRAGRSRRHGGDAVDARLRRHATTSTGCCAPTRRCWPGRSRDRPAALTTADEGDDQRVVPRARARRELFDQVATLDRYPPWMRLVHRVTPMPPTTLGPAWWVELRARVGPFARSKQLRMVRTSSSPTSASASNGSSTTTATTPSGS